LLRGAGFSNAIHEAACFEPDNKLSFRTGNRLRKLLNLPTHEGTRQQEQIATYRQKAEKHDIGERSEEVRLAVAMVVLHF
jgi:hypothetical protein